MIGMSYISVAALSSAKSNVAGSRSRPLESDGRLNEKGGGEEGESGRTGDGGDIR